MARKKGSLVAFADVANNEINKNGIEDNNKNNKKYSNNNNSNNNRKDENITENKVKTDNENDNKLNDIDDHINNNSNNHMNSNIDNNDVITNILNKKESKVVKKQVGIYFDKDVEKVLNELAKKGGRGAKSEIVNEIVKSKLKEKGLL